MSQFVEHPREPLRPLVDTPEAFDACLDSLTAGSGPVAFDAERAHGHRYWPKAYLFQIRREGSGTWLVDPIALEQNGSTKLSRLVDACAGAPWIIHAASQDLPPPRVVRHRAGGTSSRSSGCRPGRSPRRKTEHPATQGTFCGQLGHPPIADVLADLRSTGCRLSDRTGWCPTHGARRREAHRLGRGGVRSHSAKLLHATHAEEGAVAPVVGHPRSEAPETAGRGTSALAGTRSRGTEPGPPAFLDPHRCSNRRVRLWADPGKPAPGCSLAFQDPWIQHSQRRAVPSQLGPCSSFGVAAVSL